MGHGSRFVPHPIIALLPPLCDHSGSRFGSLSIRRTLTPVCLSDLRDGRNRLRPVKFYATSHAQHECRHYALRRQAWSNRLRQLLCAHRGDGPLLLAAIGLPPDIAHRRRLDVRVRPGPQPERRPREGAEGQGQLLPQGPPKVADGRCSEAGLPRQRQAHGQGPRGHSFEAGGLEAQRPARAGAEVHLPGLGCRGAGPELLAQLTPTAETSEVVAKITQAVRGVVTQVLPGVEVTGFVGASLASGKAFGVAVPEVEVVISAPHSALVHNRWQGRQRGKNECTAQQLRKSAVRVCTDRLVSEGGFKFRRSAFRGDEPRVTVVSPPALQSVPMSLSVNALTPLCNAMLISCTRIDPRTQGLVLLVKRWAKDRGLCHVARGHLSLYAWTLMSVYFLQTGAGGVLPPLTCLETPSGLTVEGQPGAQAAAMIADVLPDLSVGGLFKAFLHFYSSEFDWKGEAVSVRCGRRAAPDSRLPLHIVVNTDSKTTEVGPNIEDFDPFDSASNLGACTTATSLQHLFKESSSGRAT
ncbi:unnamed protein product [Prorocentrum cordatum]|uniref:Polynucleotide adenylyltransferase n=1 Tax=Prorocentrum cordatum TaxID=2364126 RepID=A0ABN9WWP1_9DINO|nr:unnamed protein product [Polarella glacialis]